MANWVVGYPIQTDQEIDLMDEKEAARLWEEHNKHDKVWNKALDAVGYLNVVEEHLDKGLDSLVWAKEEMDDTSVDYQIQQLIDDYENVLCDVRKLIKRFKEGDVA